MKNKFCKISIGILSICMMFLICLHFDVFKNSSKLRADVNSVPEGSLIKDYNLYRCTIDSYNYEFSTNYNYTHNFTESELSQITNLFCSGYAGYGITDNQVTVTTGIEKMTNLVSLELMLNNFTSIDLSNNLNLKTLKLDRNNTSSVDLSNNINLEELYINYDKIENLNLSNNKKLKKLTLNNNEYSKLNLNKNTALEYLDLKFNNLNFLDLSNNSLLTELYLFESFSTNITIDSLSYELLTLPSGFDFTYEISSYGNSNSSTKINVSGTKVLPLSSGNETVVYNINGENVSINYTIPESIFVTKSNNANLTSIKISVESSSGNGEIIKSNLEDLTSENIIIDELFESNIERITISATPFDSKATVSGDIGTKTLKSGKNMFVITVKAEDETVRSYNLIITKKETDEVTYKVGKKVKVKLNDNLTKEFYFLRRNDDSFILISDEMIEGTYTFDEATQKTEELKSLWTNTIEVSIPFEEDIMDLGIVRNRKINEETFLLNGYKYWLLSCQEDECSIILPISSTEGEISTELKTEKLYLRPIIAIKSEYISKIEEKTTTTTCNGILSSSKYEIDNDKKVINKVDKNDTVEEIRNNITSDCGSIVVSENNVVLTYNGNIKSYKIERYWAPKTGQTIIKYGLIITCLLIIIGLLIYILRKNK